MLSDVQAVVFDLDGTLLDRRRSFERFVRDQWERFAHVLKDVEREQYVQTLIVADRDGYAPRDELFTSITAQFVLSSALARTLLDDYRAGFQSRKITQLVLAGCRRPRSPCPENTPGAICRTLATGLSACCPKAANSSAPNTPTIALPRTESTA